MRKLSSVCFLFLLFACSNHKTLLERPFDLEFYDSLIHDIEYFDAEAIDTRNRTKSASWDEYKKYYRKKLATCPDSECAENIFGQFASGFVNLHSDFSLAGKIEPKSMIDSFYQAKPCIVFEYPSLKFFDATGDQITHLNSVPIEDVFAHYINYECRYNSTIGCTWDFVHKLNRNRLTIGERAIETITYPSGRTATMSFGKLKIPEPEELQEKFVSMMQGWELVTCSEKFILLQKGNTILLKFIDFRYSQMGSNVDCSETAAENTMCYDIQMIQKTIRTLSHIQNLVIDVQSNTGGVEVSALVAAFAKKPFYDLAIRFKKTHVLENDTTRPYLFWSNPRLENWFSTIRQSESYKKQDYNTFLDVCADFCRGSSDCSIQPIEPTGTISISNIFIVTNYNCISSCDDFVWRMKEYAGAVISGQPQAADATYSRITLAYYYRDRKLYRKEFGSGQVIDKRNLFFIATIPNSATVYNDGTPRQGIPAKLDYEVPIVKDHNKDIEMHTLFEVLKRYDLGQ